MIITKSNLTQEDCDRINKILALNWPPPPIIMKEVESLEECNMSEIFKELYDTDILLEIALKDIRFVLLTEKDGKAFLRVVAVKEAYK